MPHCWPQKQQCVCTILSGSTPVSARIPSMRLRCGPHALARASSDLGSVAIAFPEPSLRDGEHRAAARGADALIVIDVRTGRGAQRAPDVVLISQLPFDVDEVLDLQQRRVLGVAA